MDDNVSRKKGIHPARIIIAVIIGIILLIIAIILYRHNHAAPILQPTTNPNSSQ